MSKSGLT